MTNNSIGNILKLFLSSKDKKREDQETITLDTNGVIGDKFYNKNINRSVLIVSKNSYKLIEDNNIMAKYGDLGENILIDYNPYSLPMNTQLKIGNVILEISQNSTLCGHLSCIDKQLPKLLKNDRGIFAKVIQSGTININDSIYIK